MIANEQDLPDGWYAVQDPHQPGTVTCWRMERTASSTRFGPVPNRARVGPWATVTVADLPTDPAGRSEFRRTLAAQQSAYLDTVLALITADLPRRSRALRLDVRAVLTVRPPTDRSHQPHPRRRPRLRRAARRRAPKEDSVTEPSSGPPEPPRPQVLIDLRPAGPHACPGCWPDVDVRFVDAAGATIVVVVIKHSDGCADVWRWTVPDLAPAAATACAGCTPIVQSTTHSDGRVAVALGHRRHCWAVAQWVVDLHDQTEQPPTDRKDRP